MKGKMCLYSLNSLHKKYLLISKTYFNSSVKLQKLCRFINNSSHFCFKCNTTLGSSVTSKFSFNDKNIQRYMEHLSKKYNDAEKKLESEEHDSGDSWKIINNLQPLIVLNKKRETLQKQIDELELFISDLKLEKDQELFSAAEQEKQDLMDTINQCETSLVNALLPEQNEDEKDIVMEFTAGVGGQEAMLFTKLMFDMYCKYAAYKNWHYDILHYDETGLGGLRSSHISINGRNAYKLMKYESGVHRVQRVPKTEKAGRIHTSTMTIAVLPQPTDLDVALNPKDVQMTFKRSGGAGGQHVNTTDSCVRLVHIPTGIMVECEMERCQHRNRALAFTLLRARLYQMKLNEIQREKTQNRKLQVGTAARSDKIRTYNFPQDRLTDHRVPTTLHNIDQILEGEAQFDHLIMLLQNWSSIEQLREILQEYN